MLDPFAGLPFPATIHPAARPAQRLTWDSRGAGPDVAFVALPGEHMHGNKFVEQALAAGAPFILTDLDMPRAVRVPDAQEALFAWARHERAKSPLVVGISGSAGKTTAKSYVAAALDALYMPVFNTMPAIACFLIEFGGSDRPLVVEMGIDRTGEMQELMALVQPDIGVVTSIGPAHLEQLGSVERIALEKGGILAAPRGGFVSGQAAPYYPAASYPNVQQYGVQAGDDLRLTPEGATFTYPAATGDLPVFLPLASKVQAEASMLALKMAEWFGVSLTEAAGRLSGVTVPDGRYRVLPGRFTVIDDAYNASPIAVKVALDALHALPGRRVSVLGRMLELGPTEQELHTEVGAYAREKADLTFGVGAFAAELGEHAYRTVPELVEALKDVVRDGDTILVKGSRGISWTPEKRAAEGVGLDVVVNALLEQREAQGQERPG